MKNWIMILSLVCTSGIYSSVAHADLNSIVQSVKGVESDVKGSVEDIQKNTSNIFKRMGIAVTGSDMESSGAEQTLKGRKKHMDIEVKIERTTMNESHVAVTAKHGTLNFDKDYAQKILSSIIQAS